MRWLRTAKPSGSIPEIAHSDASRFLHGSDAQELEALDAAARTYRGDLLEGLSPISPEYDRWLDAERGAFRSHLISVLLRLSDAYEDANRIEDMIAVAQRLISIDPLQEHVHRRLMRAFQIQRRYDAALRQFSKLKDILAEQLGVEPEKPTLDLMRDIRAERQKGHPPGDTGGTVPVTDPKTGPDPNCRNCCAGAPVNQRPAVPRTTRREATPNLLGEGISEDVTINLSREQDLLVISRQSSFRLNDEELTPQEVGQRLGVRFCVSGTVRVFGNRLRVTAHLVNCTSGHDIWAERYDRDLDDYFEIQSEIAQIVSATAADRIAADLVEKSAAVRMEDLESYQLVLNGIREVHRFKEEGYSTAIKLFERAAERTPDYGRALGWLALSKLYLRWNIDVSKDFSDIFPIAQRAIELDPSEPKAHCASAMCNFIHRNFDRAEFDFQSAIRANPNDELILTEYGRYLMYVDRPEDGLQRIREAMRVNPFHPVWFWSIQGRVLHTLGTLRRGGAGLRESRRAAVLYLRLPGRVFCGTRRHRTDGTGPRQFVPRAARFQPCGVQGDLSLQERRYRRAPVQKLRTGRVLTRRAAILPFAQHPLPFRPKGMEGEREHDVMG